MRIWRNAGGGALVAASVLAAVAAGAPEAGAAATDPVIVTNPSPMVVLPLSDGGGTPAWPVAVSGQAGRIADVNVALNGPTVPDLGNYHVALTSPSGRTVLLKDVECSGQAVNLLVVPYIFDDEASLALGKSGAASCPRGLTGLAR